MYFYYYSTETFSLKIKQLMSSAFRKNKKRIQSYAISNPDCLALFKRFSCKPKIDEICKRLNVHETLHVSSFYCVFLNFYERFFEFKYSFFTKMSQIVTVWQNSWIIVVGWIRKNILLLKIKLRKTHCLPDSSSRNFRSKFSAINHRQFLWNALTIVCWMRFFTSFDSY